jgi:cob(I)alamin adenosyltransferase
MVDDKRYCDPTGKLNEMVGSGTLKTFQRKGLLIVHTGNGKGKTTAALGMIFRSLSYGMRCAVVQFIKSSSDSSENFFKSPLLTWDYFGEGFLCNAKNCQRDVECARMGWNMALKHIADPKLDFLLLDELNILLAKGYLSEVEVLDSICNRKTELHIVITGRGAPLALIEAADLVTEMKEIKHPLRVGISAQKGIEF